MTDLQGKVARKRQAFQEVGVAPTASFHFQDRPASIKCRTADANFLPTALAEPSSAPV